ncbi:MAG TPA: hypothetical protein VGM93_12745, partial [Acidimicrobiales bacterium]
TNPTAVVGQAASTNTCHAAGTVNGCGTWDITPTTPTVSSITFHLGYEGTGINTDNIDFMVGATPITAESGPAFPLPYEGAGLLVIGAIGVGLLRRRTALNAS